jgi:hypothetical protein
VSKYKDALSIKAQEPELAKLLDQLQVTCADLGTWVEAEYNFLVDLKREIPAETNKMDYYQALQRLAATL